MKNGQTVTIKNTTISGKPIIEGQAKLVRKSPLYESGETTEWWDVQFLGDSTTVLRLVEIQGE